MNRPQYLIVTITFDAEYTPIFKNLSGFSIKRKKS